MGTIVLEDFNKLFAAIRLNDVEAVENLIREGVDVNECDPRDILGAGNSPLHDAANNGNIKIVSLLVTAGAEINAQCDYGWTPLLRACNAGHTDVAKFLITSGAEVNIKNYEGYTALMRTMANNSELIDFLKDNGAE